MSADEVLARRRREREELLGLARRFVAALPDRLGVRAAVVVGSVARGDFNVWSDVDVLVVADHLPAGGPNRLAALGPRPGRVEPVGWTPEEWRRERARRNPIAEEALSVGIWLRGSAEALEGADGAAGTEANRPEPDRPQAR